MLIRLSLQAAVLMIVVPMTKLMRTLPELLVSLLMVLSLNLQFVLMVVRKRIRSRSLEHLSPRLPLVLVLLAQLHPLVAITLLVLVLRILKPRRIYQECLPRSVSFLIRSKLIIPLLHVRQMSLEWLL